ncbi:MAG: TadA family conjugal transfer-associated ATPase [Microbacterium sp.]|nr:TadA family conjugal transfer-associated ATPase [Microbacterium sp.]
MTEPFVARPRGPLPRVAVDARSASRSGPPSDAVPVSAGAAGAAGAVDPAGVAAVEDQAPEKAVVRPPWHPVLEPFVEFLDDPGVTDLFVNGGDGLFVDRGSGATRVARWRATEPEVRDLAVALIGLGGRHIDDASPCVDVRLDGGIRVHAVLPPIASGGTAISIRVPRAADVGLAGLAARGLVDVRGRERLERLVADRENLLISGAGGSGKTTLLGALLALVPHSERIVTIEDVAELRVDHPHHVRLEARQPNLEGAGGVGLARLVREALRMRPDRLVVGECRGAEVRELLSALNTGHDGGAGTLHANGLEDVPARLEALGALAGLDDAALARQVASAIGCVLHLERGRDGRRRLAAVGRPIVVRGRLGIEAVPWS